MNSEAERLDWMNTTCSNTLQLIVNILTLHFTQLQSVLLNDVYKLFAWCINSDSEQLALTGTNQWKRVFVVSSSGVLSFRERSQ
jgi:predicted nucleotide-binding protein